MPKYLLLALSMLLAVFAFAQEQTVNEDGAEESTEQVPEAAAEPDRSPFDYEASEQISEDLPVSFPVDI